MMNEQTGAQETSMATKGNMMHWACCILPIATLLLWLASIVFVVMSWVSVTNETGEVAGYGPQWWIWNAVMFGILALYGKGGKIGACRMCGCKAGCGCKNGACVCK